MKNEHPTPMGEGGDCRSEEMFNTYTEMSCRLIHLSRE